jgi:hypothetical protein
LVRRNLLFDEEDDMHLQLSYFSTLDAARGRRRRRRGGGGGGRRDDDDEGEGGETAAAAVQEENIGEYFAVSSLQKMMMTMKKI